MYGTARTPLKDDAFFANIAAGMTITPAAVEAGYSRSRVFQYKIDDEEFASRWHEASEDATERMETEADRRGVEGVLEPVFHKGVEVGYIRKFSDTLLIFRLKAKRPQVYRDNARVEHSNDPENPMPGDPSSLFGWTPEQIEALIQLELSRRLAESERVQDEEQRSMEEVPTESVGG